MDYMTGGLLMIAAGVAIYLWRINFWAGRTGGTALAACGFMEVTKFVPGAWVVGAIVGTAFSLLTERAIARAQEAQEKSSPAPPGKRRGEGEEEEGRGDDGAAVHEGGGPVPAAGRRDRIEWRPRRGSAGRGADARGGRGRADAAGDAVGADDGRPRC